MQKTNEHKFPLIENILILGLKSNELNALPSLNMKQIEELSHIYKPKIIQNYQSNLITQKINPEDELYKKICEFSFPKGVINYSENNNFDKIENITFCLKYNNTIQNKTTKIIKHITCGYIQSWLKIANKNIICIYTGIVLVSSIDIYECHKEILSYLINIITNYFIKSTNNSQNMKVYINALNVTKLFEEYRLIPFYISLLINLNIDNNMSKKNLCITCIENNYFKNIFCKILLKNKNNNSILLLKEYDTSIILDKFYVDDLIMLYCALLLNVSIIFLFNDYYQINLIINSLLSLTYPIDCFKKYNINYIYDKAKLKGQKLIITEQEIKAIHFDEDEDLTCVPEEGNIPSFVSSSTEKNDDIEYLPCLNFYYPKNTIVYSIKDKKFLNYPLKHKNNFISEEILNDIKSQLYFVCAEKITINSDMNFDETDLGLIFENSICKKINTFLYLNLKIKAIFFRAFLMILKGLNSFLDFNFKFQNAKSFTIDSYFKNINEFTKGSKIRNYLVKDNNFQEFLIFGNDF